MRRENKDEGVVSSASALLHQPKLISEATFRLLNQADAVTESQRRRGELLTA